MSKSRVIVLQRVLFVCICIYAFLYVVSGFALSNSIPIVTIIESAHLVYSLSLYQGTTLFSIVVTHRHRHTHMPTIHSHDTTQKKKAANRKHISK